MDPAIPAAAWADYEAAARGAGVEVRALRADECPAAATLLSSLWSSSVLEAPALVALAHAGSYVAGAFDGDRMVGACVGFLSQPLGEAMHSHVAGVLPDAAGRGIGTAMKLHQRAWCLDLGLTRMTWTFDPLVARNASFNLRRLGAEVTDYLVDFYGTMTDGVNAGQGSDRAFVTWRLDAPLPASADPADASAGDAARPADASGGCNRGDEILSVGPGELPVSSPLRDDATRAVAALPADIEATRRTTPDTAALWRSALRDAVVPLLEDGWTIAAVTRDGRYRLEKP